MVKHERRLSFLPRRDWRVEDGRAYLKPGAHVPDQALQARAGRWPRQDLVGHLFYVRMGSMGEIEKGS